MSVRKFIHTNMVLRKINNFIHDIKHSSVSIFDANCVSVRYKSSINHIRILCNIYTYIIYNYYLPVYYDMIGRIIYHH